MGSLRLSVLAQEKVHDFSDSQGRKIQAVLIAFVNGQVTIRRVGDGQQFSVPLNSLSKEDQQHVVTRSAESPHIVKERAINIRPQVAMRMIWCPSGEFRKRSQPQNGVAQPDEVVVIKDGFWIGKYEVSQAEYIAVMGDNPSKFTLSRSYPVDNANLKKAQEFCEKAGKFFYLPSSAQWEYACRAGSMTEYSFGDDEAMLKDYGWFKKNSGAKTHAVGQLRPNAWGIHDMHGNVTEWTIDRNSNIFQGIVVVRKIELAGGYWENAANECRSASFYEVPWDPNGDQNLGYVGFRVAATPVQNNAPQN